MARKKKIETAEREEEKRKRFGIYLLPNLFTTAAMFSGFYAIILAMKGSFESSVIAIFIAMLADGLDGRVARLTNTQTQFGAEYDSLSDLTSFGVAPALLLYLWTLQDLGKFGWLVAFVYVAAVALRLARFNTQVGIADKRYFQGLSCTAAAGMTASFVWFSGVQYDFHGISMNLIASVYAVVIAALMVSNIRYHSFKGFDLRGRVRFVTLLILVLIFVGISLDPPKVFLTVFFAYGLSGPIFTLWNLRKRRFLRRKHLK